MADRLKHMVPLYAAFLLAGVVGSPLLAGPAPKEVVTKERSFYLTMDPVQGDSTKTACASGYHFASVWELLNAGSMAYNNILGQSNDDSGSGPPMHALGWVRSGLTSDPYDNCSAWTTIDTLPTSTASTTFEFLMEYDSTAHQWFLSNEIDWGQCFVGRPVWCVSDSIY